MFRFYNISIKKNAKILLYIKIAQLKSIFISFKNQIFKIHKFDKLFFKKSLTLHFILLNFVVVCIMKTQFISGFILVFLFMVACQEAPTNSKNPYIGEWIWEKSGKEASFSIKIFQKGDSLMGTYCGLSKGGAKMDCGVDSNDIAFWFKKTDDKKVVFDFQSYTENDWGEASLALNEGKLIWNLIRAPKTEHFALENAILVKRK